MSQSSRNFKPLDAAKVEELALAYVARFATTQAKLEAYLARKIRERGWKGEPGPDIAAIAGKFVEAGYVDDAAYAKAKAGSLLRRGYGARRVDQALFAAGVANEVREGLCPAEADRRQAALAMAKKRRFGPFGAEPSDPARREKQLAAMIRAGHAFDTAREIINAQSVEAIESWADELSPEEGCD